MRTAAVVILVLFELAVLATVAVGVWRLLVRVRAAVAAIADLSRQTAPLLARLGEATAGSERVASGAARRVHSTPPE